ncbi:hypothetical protein Tco_0868376 [Tanacetum coccineum]
MDHYTKNALWIYWTRGDDEVELTDKESSDPDDEDEVSEIFRIDTNAFDFETPMYKAFKEFNYLLQIDLNLLTKDIDGFKTYKEYKYDWIYEWNKDIPWKDDGYCNDVNLSGAYIVGNTLRYQDLECKKIWHIRAYTSQITTKDLRPNTPYSRASICRIQGLLHMKILKDIERGPYSKKSPIRRGGLVKMDDPNITMEEYIRIEEEKARRRGKVYNWETATYAIVFDDAFTSEVTLSCKPTVSPLNGNKIEDYTVIYDKNSFSYKIISVDDLKTDSKNNNDKVNMPSFPSPEPTTELTVSSQYIDEFNLKDETSLSKYNEEEQNVLYFNDLFPFNIIYPDDLKSDKDNDDNEIDIIQPSGGDVINTDDGAYTHGSNKLLETSHDTSNKFFKTETFIKELNNNIVAWNYLNNGMLLNLIKNLYVPFGNPFDPKLFYKDGIKLGQV